MNVVLLAPRLPPQFDGVGDHAHALASALASDGHNVVALTAGTASLQERYRVRVLGASWGWKATLAACRELRRLRPDVVLLEYTPFVFGGRSPAPIVIPRFARLFGIPCTVVAHEIFYPRDSTAVSSKAKARYFAWRDAVVLKAATRIAVPNAERRERIHAKLPRLSGRVDLVPIAANVEPNAGYVRRTHQGVVQIVAFGVVMQRRRYEIAIRALAEIRRTLDARLTIVGRIFESDYAARCMQVARSLQIEPYVTFTDSVGASEVSTYLAGADLAVHTTMEGCTRSSGSLLALLAHALPVVAVRAANDDACFDEIVAHADEDPSDVARVLRDLASDRTRAAALGARALATYRARFDWRALAQSLIAS